MTVTQERQESHSLAKNANFDLLLAGQFVSQMGDRLAMVALPWLVYHRTHSAMSTGLMLAIFTLPYVAFGTAAGVLLDRLNKRAVMIAADVMRGGLVLSVPYVAQRSIDGLFVLAFATATATAFFEPGLMAFLPEIVRERDLLRANSLLSASMQSTEVVGFAAAGLVVAWLPLHTTFAVDAATFGVSAVTLLAMTTAGASATAARSDAQTTLRLWASAREGIAYTVRHRGLRANTAMAVAAAAGIGAFYPLSFLLAVRHFNSLRSFGFMEAGLALGFLAASLGTAWLAKRIRKGLAITVGLMIMGMCAAVPTLLGTLPLVLGDFVVLGAANAVMLISIDTYVQSVVPEYLRGRVWGARFTLTQGVYAIGVLAAGGLAAVVSLGPLFGVCGAIVFVPALIGFFVPVVRDI